MVGPKPLDHLGRRGAAVDEIAQEHQHRLVRRPLVELTMDSLQQCIEQVEAAVDVAHDIGALALGGARPRLGGSQSTEHAGFNSGGSNFLQRVEISANYERFAIFGEDFPPRLRGHRLNLQSPQLRKPAHRVAQRLRILCLTEEAVHAVDDHLPASRNVCRDQRPLHCPGLEQGARQTHGRTARRPPLPQRHRAGRRRSRQDIRRLRPPPIGRARFGKWRSGAFVERDRAAGSEPSGSVRRLRAAATNSRTPLSPSSRAISRKTGGPRGAVQAGTCRHRSPTPGSAAPARAGRSRARGTAPGRRGSGRRPRPRGTARTGTAV